jgi:hypothetical protein
MKVESPVKRFENEDKYNKTLKLRSEPNYKENRKNFELLSEENYTCTLESIEE